MNICRTALLSFSLVLVSTAAHAGPFGAASAYNLVALGSSTYAGNITLGTADVGGRIAAAGTITSGPYGTTVLNNLANDTYGSPSLFAVVATGGLTPGSTLYMNSAGNVYTPNSNGTIDFNHGGSRITTGPSGINFASLASSLDTLTTQLAAFATTGIVRPGTGSENPSWTVLQGTSGINIFNLTAAQFATATLDIEVPAGATVIINVAGTSETLGNAIYLNGVQYHGDTNADQDILFNFPDATGVDLSAGLDASVLAPFALLTDNGGQIDGNFIAAQIDLTNSAEAHNVEFTGTLPPTDPVSPTPEPTTLALMGTGILGLAGALRSKLRT